MEGDGLITSVVKAGVVTGAGAFGAFGAYVGATGGSIVAGMACTGLGPLAAVCVPAVVGLGAGTGAFLGSLVGEKPSSTSCSRTWVCGN